MLTELTEAGDINLGVHAFAELILVCNGHLQFPPTSSCAKARQLLQGQARSLVELGTSHPTKVFVLLLPSEGRTAWLQN